MEVVKVTNIFDVVDDGIHFVMIEKDSISLFEHTDEIRQAIITKTGDGFTVKFSSFAGAEDKQIAMRLIDVLSKHIIE